MFGRERAMFDLIPWVQLVAVCAIMGAVIWTVFDDTEDNKVGDK